MRAIKDSVHGYVELDDLARDLLDTWPLQRLRHVKQLSTVRLVYPSANHTRFEHSLGVYHLARRALEHLEVNGARADVVRAAALLHDVGHGPYGHQTEPVIRRRTGRHHDEVRDLLAETEVADVLADHGIDVDAVAARVDGEDRLGQLISGELDVDRLDYLVRDAHHSGVPYGTVDQERMLRGLTFRDGNLVLAEGNVVTAESVLVARALMNAAVYRHHVSRIAGAMLERVAERLLDRTQVGVEEFARMTDDDLLETLLEHESTVDAARRLRNRTLFKRAVWAEREAVPETVRGTDHDDQRRFEREIAERADVDPDRVVVDVPSRPKMPEISTRVVVNGEVRRLSSVSALVDGLRAMDHARWRMGVYAPESIAPRVGSAAVDVMGLEASVETA
jgi:HD superfamily phosphohydrolase